MRQQGPDATNRLRHGCMASLGHSQPVYITQLCLLTGSTKALWALSPAWASVLATTDRAGGLMVIRLGHSQAGAGSRR
jgi:hypothetical protein